MTLRAFGSLCSFEGRDLAFSCSENKSDVERARVGEVASGGGDDGRVDVGESRKELACDVVRIEGTEEDAAGVTEIDPRLSKESGETNASGDAGFRRSASMCMCNTVKLRVFSTTSKHLLGTLRIDISKNLNAFLIFPTSPT